MGFAKVFCNEFKLQKLFLTYEYPGKFAQFECGFPRGYIVWRLLWMLYHITAITVSGLLEQYYASTAENRIKWFIYLTNWTFIVMVLANILDFCSTVFMQKNYPDSLREDHDAAMPWYLKAVWLMTSIYNTISILVSISYWTFAPSTEWSGLDRYHLLPFLGHGMNSIYVFSNLCVTGAPVRLLHFWPPIVFAAIYGVFNVAYTTSGATDDTDKHYIYKLVDWLSKPKRAEVATVAVVAAIISIHTCIFLLYLLRRSLAKVCLCKEENVTPAGDNHDEGVTGPYGSLDEEMETDM